MLEPLSAMHMTNASDNIRFSRPDMYLSTTDYNRSAYIDAILGKANMVNMTYIDPRSILLNAA